MGTKFYSLTKWGAQIIFCVTLTLFMSAFSFTASGQSLYPVIGDNLFRGNGYGVGEHNYIMTTKVGVSTYPPVILNTSASYCGIWDGNIRLNNVATIANNELKIRPTSPNNYSDYINGITSLDALRLQKHIIGTEPFTTGFQKVAADANNDGQITSADKMMITNLILGVSTSFTRNSWEWFHKEYMDPFPTSFFNNPYQFTLSATYPNVSGFGEWVVSNQSRNTILSNLPSFRTVKIGDIYSPSGTGATHNSWVCGAVPYFNEETEIFNRSSSIESQIINNGDVVIVEVFLSEAEDVVAAEFPIYIDNAKFSIEKIEFMNGFEPIYNYNSENNLLTFLYLQNDLRTLNISNSEVIKLKLKANHKVENFSNFVKWDDSRNVEFNNINLEPTNAYAELRIMDIISNSLVINAQAYLEKLYIVVSAVKEIENSSIIISNMQGQVLSRTNVNIEIGKNKIELPCFLPGGLYIATLKTKDKLISNKFVVQN